MLRLTALLALAALAPWVHASDRGCTAATPNEAVACEQQRAEVELSALSARYTRVWAQLPADRRIAFATAERRWLNGGRWDDHAACVSNAVAAPAELIAAKCLADITAAHLDALNAARDVREGKPQN